MSFSILGGEALSISVHEEEEQKSGLWEPGGCIVATYREVDDLSRPPGGGDSNFIHVLVPRRSDTGSCFLLPASWFLVPGSGLRCSAQCSRLLASLARFNIQLLLIPRANDLMLLYYNLLAAALK